MSTGSTTAVETASGGFSDYLELTKPRLSFLVLTTTLVGYLVASPTTFDIVGLAAALLGATLVVAGANAMNQVYEREVDALMARTRHRPLPSGRLWARPAGAFGFALGIAGTALLTLLVNPLAGALGAAGFVLYVFVYTPLKRITHHCTLVGAIPGAIPPLIGWAAARGSLDAAAAALFGILFLWQMPHFLAIARMYRDDYNRAGMVMLGLDEDGSSAYATMIAFCVALIPVAASMTWLGATGWIYLAAALLLGFGFLAAAIRASRERTRTADRKAFFFSLIYLTGLLAVMLIDRQPPV
jgi:protoheme IX farnesyltransferase